MLGTSSGVGKTLVATALIRAFKKRGIDVAPFKPLNVSLNAGVGRGGEMAYAQVVQARAAGLEPDACMNPVLAKPEAGGLHVVVRGRHAFTVSHEEFSAREVQERLFYEALECFNKLSNEHELVIIEGTGSPAEVNMPGLLTRGFFKAVKARSVLVADVLRGGAFASILGTLDVIGRDGVIGAILNKMAGDERYILNSRWIMKAVYGVEILGVLPLYSLVFPWEDSLDVPRPKRGKVNFLVVSTPYMSNFTDAYPLYSVPEVGVTFADYYMDGFDAIIIPGSKVTAQDVLYMRREGIDEGLRGAASEGRLILGICGGFQALGTKIIDYVESKAGEIEGLGLLPNKTVMGAEKVVARSSGVVIRGLAQGLQVSGYEIHYGITESVNGHLMITEREGAKVSVVDGEVSGSVLGTYLHGILDNEGYTLALVNRLRAKKGLEPLRGGFTLSYEPLIETLADEAERRINLDLILGGINPGRST